MQIHSVCPACEQNLSFDASLQLVYPLRSGLILYLENSTDWSVVGEVFVNQIYAPALKKVKFPPGVFRAVDLGSNVGYFSLWLADKLLQVGQEFKIEAIDASGKNCEVFAKRFTEQHRLEKKCEVSLRNAAVGLRSGAVKIYEDIRFHAKTGITLDLDQPDSPSRMVPYVDLDSVIAPGPIHLLKVDIEASEEAFVQTYSNSFLRRVQVCVMEIHEAFVNLDNIMKEMKLADFTFCDKILQDGNVSVWLWHR